MFKPHPKNKPLQSDVRLYKRIKVKSSLYSTDSYFVYFIDFVFALELCVTVVFNYSEWLYISGLFINAVR